MANWLIYGATGYTGTLVADEAVRRGHRPILAGRSARKLAPLAERLGCELRAVGLDDGAALRRALAGLDVVLHCAGPFVETAARVRSACLEVGASYADITGELPVFRDSFAADRAARERGVAILSGVGFDVVPTDCLAAHVAARVPGATSLELAIAPLGGPSRGTMKSALRALPAGGLVRRGGELRPFAFGRGGKRVRFPDRERTVVPIPWGDLETAYWTTRIPDITTYLAVPASTARFLRVSWPAIAAGFPITRRILGTRTVQERGRRLIDRRPEGPSAEARQRGKSLVWARAAGPDGAAEAWLTTREGYDFTAIAAVRSVERLLRDHPTGALTPAGAFGADFVLEIEGTTRTDVPPAL